MRVMIVKPAKRIRGDLRMPGDKSISHRAAMIAALAHGRSHIRNFSNSDDCHATLACLEQLGVSFQRGTFEIFVSGVGIRGLTPPPDILDCRNSGTTMRLLAGILAGTQFETTLAGDQSLLRRPMQRIIEPLEMMGAKISSTKGHAPLTIKGAGSLRAIEYELLVASAQVKSAILFAGLNADGRTTVIEAEPTRDHTERMLRAFGGQVESRAEGENARFIAIDGPSDLHAQNFAVPGDVSSAAYFIAAACLLPGSSLEIADAGLNPTRIEFLKQFRTMGFDIQITDETEEHNEPRGIIRAAGNRPGKPERSGPHLTIDGLLIPKLIDELPLLAIVGSQIEGGIEIRNAAELRVKESDRIATTLVNLHAMGADVEEFDDGFRVPGPVRLRGAGIDCFGDHRIAMSFAIAGLIADGETEIKDAECVAVSFPEFFKLLNSVVEY
jgi:3-phosphoshikimate 1-carboxyvinyltransferase